jgi:hypothetical protein
MIWASASGLAGEADFVMGAIVGEGSTGEEFGFIAGIGGRTDQAHGVGAVPNNFIARGSARTTEDFAHDGGADLADGRIATGGHERDEGAEAVGMLDGHGLRDLATHGGTEDVSFFDAEGIEEAGGVGGHIGEGVGGGGVIAGESGGEIGRRSGGHVGGMAGVAIVEADDLDTVIDKHVAEGVGPVNHLCCATHDHEQRGRVGRAELLVGDVDVGRANVGGDAFFESGVDSIDQFGHAGFSFDPWRQ